MEASHVNRVVSVLLFFITSVPLNIECSRVFTIINDCKETVWPAVTPGDNFNGGGFRLKPGQSAVFTAPVGWSGRIWGRTGCSFDRTGEQNGTCETGGCLNALKCAGSGNTPSTLAEFTLASPDFYDVSLVDGFNLPVTVNNFESLYVVSRR
ncbi:Thaumatin-like protein [Acorus gramineus]|uniref:Thaumatin-like protein n=1 Tax=Acorus gramineus TaxID=55184 RepID=A0AAV9BHY0_ACOGR|nr:Thaumatin-like protein [Acorus gramineus]